MNTMTKPSKDTILMCTLTMASLAAVGAGTIHSSEQTRAREAALMVVKSATLIVEAKIPAAVGASVNAAHKTSGLT